MGHQGTVDLADLQRRMKSLLKEPDNARCSECRSKKNKPKYFSLLQTPERGQLGVFCCKNCREFHLALGVDYATVKCLKKPEEWTEQDVETLEQSGNKAVNTIYESGLEGNHTDKHMGALASSAFVESKYKLCLYFSEKAYEEQVQLRAMLQFAKDQKPREKPPPPSVEDLVKKALKRQSMLVAPKPKEGEEVLLRGFGTASANDDDPKTRFLKENSAPEPRDSKRGTEGRRRNVQKSKSWDPNEVELLESARRGRKSDLSMNGNNVRRPGNRATAPALRRAMSLKGESLLKGDHVRRGTLIPPSGSAHNRRPRHRRIPTIDEGELPPSSSGSGGRRHRRVSSGEGPTTEPAGNHRMRRASTTFDRHSVRGSGHPAVGRRSTMASSDLKGNRQGERLAKSAHPPPSDFRLSTGRPRSSSREEIPNRSSSRGSASPSSNGRTDRKGASPSGNRGERKSPSTHGGHKDPRRVADPDEFEESSHCSGSSESFHSEDFETNGVYDDDLSSGSGLSEDDKTAVSSNSDAEQDEISEKDNFDDVAWSRSPARGIVSERGSNGHTMKTGGSLKDKKQREERSVQFSKDKQRSMEPVEGVTWSRGGAHPYAAKARGRRQSSVRQILVDAGENLEAAVPAFHRQTTPSSLGSSNDSKKGSRKLKSETPRRVAGTSETTKLDKTSQHSSQKGVMDTFGLDGLGDDGFGTSFQKVSEADFANDAFGTPFTDFGFGRMDFSSGGDLTEDEDNGCLLSKKLTLSSSS